MHEPSFEQRLIIYYLLLIENKVNTAFDCDRNNRFLAAVKCSNLQGSQFIPNFKGFFQKKVHVNTIYVNFFLILASKSMFENISHLTMATLNIPQGQSGSHDQIM